jgi:hypothetical protein
MARAVASAVAEATSEFWISTAANWVLAMIRSPDDRTAASRLLHAACSEQKKKKQQLCAASQHQRTIGCIAVELLRRHHEMCNSICKDSIGHTCQYPGLDAYRILRAAKSLAGKMPLATKCDILAGVLQYMATTGFDTPFDDQNVEDTMMLLLYVACETDMSDFP